MSYFPEDNYVKNAEEQALTESVKEVYFFSGTAAKEFGYTQARTIYGEVIYYTAVISIGNEDIYAWKDKTIVGQFSREEVEFIRKYENKESVLNSLIIEESNNRAASIVSSLREKFDQSHTNDSNPESPYKKLL